MLPLIGLLCGVLSSALASQLEIVHQWSLLTYNTPSWYPRNSTTFGGNPIASIEADSDRIFLAIPSEYTVAPATLVYVPKHAPGTDVPLEAYPNWEYHAGAIDGHSKPNCHGIISAFKLRVDKCGRLWVLDNGNILNLRSISTYDEVNICPPKLIVFDLHTDQEVRRIEFKEGFSAVNSRLVNFVLDNTDEYGAETPGNCDTGHIYISNMRTPSIVVYNQQTTEWWLHSDPSFHPDPKLAVLEVPQDEPIISMLGIYQLTLSSPGYGGHRELFYAPVASATIYAVDTAALKARPPPSYRLKLPVRKVVNKRGTTFALAYDPVDGSLLFNVLNETSIVTWNLEDSKPSSQFVDLQNLQTVADIQPAILDDNNIWVVSTRGQYIVYNRINPHEINQRVMRFTRKPLVPTTYPGPLLSF